VSFNGSLWTLVFEAGCYGLVALLGALGLLRRRPAGALAVLTALQEAGAPGLMNERLLRLTFVFVLGMLAFLYADRIPRRVELAAICAVIFLVSVMLFEDYRVLGAIPWAYVFFWFAVRFPWPWTMREDLSYGLYIYHWPVLQLLVVAGPASLATPVFIAAGLAVTAILAAFSWYWVEKPALGRKHSELPDRIAALVLRRPADLASTGAHRRLGDQPSREGSVGLVVPSSDPGDVPVTRIEVLDFVAEAFDAVPVRPRSLVEVAIGNGARDAVLEVLCRLPDVELRESAQLWDHLEEVPESLPRSR
jgi:peptidoglycan/LPS O-acetylase OafA/YrhL